MVRIRGPSMIFNLLDISLRSLQLSVKHWHAYFMRRRCLRKLLQVPTIYDTPFTKLNTYFVKIFNMSSPNHSKYKELMTPQLKVQSQTHTLEQFSS